MNSMVCLLTASTLGLVACGPAGRSDFDDGNADASPVVDSGPAQACQKMDIVFVVDDSGSMSEEQSNLAANFPMFADLISNHVTADGTRLDFRVALTTTAKSVYYRIDMLAGPIEFDNGADGAFVDTCGVDRRWIEAADPDIGATLACRANVGASGSGFEMPLLMVQHALSDRVTDGTNAGFLRDDALLAVVILTDEDDGSSTRGQTPGDFILVEGIPGTYPLDIDPSDTISYLDTLKGHRSRWAAGVIAGDGECSSSFGAAADAPRLKSFVQQANMGGTTQAVFTSICEGDLTNALTKVLTAFQTACGNIILRRGS